MSSRLLKSARVYARNVLRGGNISALGLARAGRWFEYVSENLFLYRSMAGRRGVHAANVFEVFPPPDHLANISLGYLVPPGDGFEPWFTELSSYTADLVSICLLCRVLAPRVVFEIGTFHGYTTHHLALNSPADARIYSLDLPTGEIRSGEQVTRADEALVTDDRRGVDRLFERHESGRKVDHLTGDSATFDFSPFHHQVDLFLIDGAHTYDYVRTDTLRALECTRPGGVIVWHDYGRTGFNEITPWIDQLARTRPVYAIPGGSLAFMPVGQATP